MVEFIKNWASGIIVAVIIATLIEMILPENKNKKYIKTVIGIYILFTIISPMISNALTDGELEVSKYEKYLTSSDESYNLTTNFEMNHTSNIQKIYEDQLKEDIKTKLKAKGFEVTQIELEIITEEGEEYGELKMLKLCVSEKEEIQQEENKITNEISIHKIEIGNLSNQAQNTQKSTITDKQKNEIKTYLKEEYGIKKENITIQ